MDLFNRLNPSEKYLVVYAGAADGRHMPLLTEMYPNIVMHLYDPRQFYQKIDDKKNRIILNPFVPDANKRGWFADEVANNYKTTTRYKDEDRLLVFISDTRSTVDEPAVLANQREQERWVRTMRPVWSMLKWKCPYPKYDKPEYYKHMRGDIRFQAWAPSYSAETRLITHIDDISKDENYPVNLFERNTAWYNSVLRSHDFTNVKVSKFGLTSKDETFVFWNKYSSKVGFDHVYETMIIKDYLIWRGDKLTLDNVEKIIEKINHILIDKGAKFDNYLRGQGYHLV